jgi:hypothetical protein
MAYEPIRLNHAALRAHARAREPVASTFNPKGRRFETCSAHHERRANRVLSPPSESPKCPCVYDLTALETRGAGESSPAGGAGAAAAAGGHEGDGARCRGVPGDEEPVRFDVNVVEALGPGTSSGLVREADDLAMRYLSTRR